MTGSRERFAVYIAPKPDSILWRLGSQILGYDAQTGLAVPGFTAAGLMAEEWDRLTARPRTYGFHATLKAPFALASGMTANDVLDGVEAIATRTAAFDLGALAVTCLAQSNRGFAALTLRADVPALAALEADTVASLDHLRAPLTTDEIASRRPERLTERQRESLYRYGYPYVGPDYRFHMTLTGETERAPDIADALADIVAERIGTTHLQVDALVVFRQAAAGQPFRIIERIALRSAMPAATQIALNRRA